MTDTINLLYEIIQLITPPDTGKSPPTAYRFSQLKQGTYLIRLKPRMFIHIFRFILGIHNRLIFIQSIISGCRITDRNRDQIKRNSLKSEHLKCDQNRCNRTVCHSAEYRSHSTRRTDRRRKSKPVSHHTAKRCTDTKRRYNLTTTESRTHRQSSQNQSPEDEPALPPLPSRSVPHRLPYNL